MTISMTDNRTVGRHQKIISGLRCVREYLPT
nr:MAG TPA: hypothetical protein [Caudoviricetes sp.]